MVLHLHPDTILEMTNHADGRLQVIPEDSRQLSLLLRMHPDVIIDMGNYNNGPLEAIFEEPAKLSLNPEEVVVVSLSFLPCDLVIISTLNDGDHVSDFSPLTPKSTSSSESRVQLIFSKSPLTSDCYCSNTSSCSHFSLHEYNHLLFDNYQILFTILRSYLNISGILSSNYKFSQLDSSPGHFMGREERSIVQKKTSRLEINIRSRSHVSVLNKNILNNQNNFCTPS